MKTNQTQMLTNAALFGLLMSATSFLLTLLYWIFDVNIASIGMGMLITLISFGVTILFFWLSNKTLRDKYLGGNLTYGQGFVNLLITGIVSVIVGSLFTYCFHKYIAPEYMSKMMAKMLETFQSNPNMPAEAIEKIQAQIDGMTPENTVTKAIPWGLGGTVVLSLIVSAFTKKNPDIFAVENSTEEAN